LSSLDIFVATSIVPNHREEIQFKATKSWQLRNLNVLSLNSHQELKQLTDKYPHVNFIENNRTGKLLTEKPVVFISDLLHSLRLTKAQTLGIINSDIIVDGSSDFFKEIISLTKMGLVYGPRLDVFKMSDADGVLDPFGFDFFFFDRSFINVWYESQFCLGMPFWDYWFPLMVLLNKKLAIKLITDKFRHVIHPTNRDNSFFLFNDYFAQEIIMKIQKNEIGFGSNFDISEYHTLRLNAENKIEHNYNENLIKFYDGLSKYVLKFLGNTSQIIKK